MSNNTVNTKAFWLQVQKEYEIGLNNGYYFICYASPKFEIVWMTQATNICDLAREFKVSCRFSNFTVGEAGGFLFAIENITVPLDDRINIRKDFIQWCINKFQ